MLIVKQVLKIISDRRASSKSDYTLKKKKISTVIYPSLKSYTSFERAYNNLSRKKLYFALCKPIIIRLNFLQDIYSYNLGISI